MNELAAHGAHNESSYIISLYSRSLLAIRNGMAYVALYERRISFTKDTDSRIEIGAYDSVIEGTYKNGEEHVNWKIIALLC